MPKLSPNDLYILAYVAVAGPLDMESLCYMVEGLPLEDWGDEGPLDVNRSKFLTLIETHQPGPEIKLSDWLAELSSGGSSIARHISGLMSLEENKVVLENTLVCVPESTFEKRLSMKNSRVQRDCFEQVLEAVRSGTVDLGEGYKDTAELALMARTELRPCRRFHVSPEDCDSLESEFERAETKAEENKRSGPLLLRSTAGPAPHDIDYIAFGEVAARPKQLGPMSYRYIQHPSESAAEVLQMVFSDPAGWRLARSGSRVLSRLEELLNGLQFLRHLPAVMQVDDVR